MEAAPLHNVRTLFGLRFTGSSGGHARAMTLRTLAMVAAALAVAVPAAAVPAAAGGPSVTVVSKSPLQLRGVSFRPRILVTVTLATRQGRVVKRVRTSAVGRFTARFAVAVDACNGANAATVSTSSGYRLDLRLVPRGACAPIQPVDQ